MSSADIGSAAAYEAYRMWRHHHGTLFGPLGGERERERECLVGLATAEGTFTAYFLTFHFLKGLLQFPNCGLTLDVLAILMLIRRLWNLQVLLQVGSLLE